MAKKANNPERLIFCSGKTWEGDGSKQSSPCQFGESRVTSADRFKCHNCSVGTTPAKVLADENGVTEQRKELIVDEKKAQKKDDDCVSDEERETPPNLKFPVQNDPPAQNDPPDTEEKTLTKKIKPKNKRKKRRRL